MRAAKKMWLRGNGIPPLAEASWAQIAEISEAGLAPVTWVVGDQKAIIISGTSYTFQIIGFNHDILSSDGVSMAGITFQMVDCMNTNHPMNWTNTNVGGWDSTTLRNMTLRSSIWDGLPSDLRSVVKTVNKKSSIGNASYTIETIQDTLFLLTEIEVLGTTNWTRVGEGTRYSFYASGGSRIKKVSGVNSFWWFRGPYKTAVEMFAGLSNTGSGSASDASNSRGLSFAFCV